MPKRFNQIPKRERLAGEDWLIDKGGLLWKNRPPTTEEQRLLLTIMGGLPDPYRSVIEMRFWGRMTYQAIAEEMGWPDRRWAAVYLRRGLDRMKMLMIPPQEDS